MKSSLIIKAMQMNYLQLLLGKDSDDNRCPICWRKDCNHNTDVKVDPFINLTEELHV